MGPLAAAGLSLAGGVLGGAWNAAEARRNRQWQERMSNTAWQREAADMRKAGINPLVKFGSGASTPPGDRAEAPTDLGSDAVASALSAKLMKAQVRKTEAEADMVDKQRFILDQEWQHWKPEEWNLKLDRARAEIQNITNSARAAKARALLDEAARTGALNAERWEREIGEMGPWVRAFIQMLRGVRQ